MMSLPPDDKHAPRLSDPTAVDLGNPFDSTPDRERLTQLSSDPPTSLVRHDNFRELPPGSIVGEIYEIDARLGAGAMGEVYAARHMKLGKRVAIKVIGQRLSEDAAAIERFTMEARTLAKIQHPAIVAVEHVGELADGRAFFVMEYLRGESLFERICRGRVSLTESLRILDQMARGLEAAHQGGVMHRDLKPENVFLVHLPSEPPIIKLVDFGLSKLTADRADDDQRTERTQSGVAIGTPMYMSPEQMRGPDVDHRTDIYALGTIAYELLLGSPPFPHARTAPELYAAHLHESPPLPRSIWPDIPPQLDLVLFAMLAKDSAHRPTLAQVRAVIAAVRKTSPAQRAATEFVGPRASGSRGLKIVAVMIAMLIGGIAIGVTLSTRSRQESPESVDVSKVPSELPSKLPAPALLAPPVASTPIPDDAPPASKPDRPAPPISRHKVHSTPSETVIAPDAGVDAEVVVPIIPPVPPLLSIPDKSAPKPKPKTIDKNQTVNPFAKKHGKVNP